MGRLVRRLIELVTLIAVHLPIFLHLLACKGLFLPVKEGGRLFKVLPLLPFADDPLFFNHTLETLD